MASISLGTITSTSIQVKITGLSTSAKYIEYSIDDEVIDDVEYTITSSSDVIRYTYGSLRPNTTYTFSVVVYTADRTPLSFKNNWVEGTTEEEVSELPEVYVYYGNRWRQVQPYVYYGSRWREVTPYIYYGGRWRQI